MRLAAFLVLLLGCNGGTTSDGTDETDTDIDLSLIDADEDGSPASEDCDDNDFERTPGADEYCDGKDNDCDELVDEDAVNAETYYGDADRDGFGDDDSTTRACQQPPDSTDRGGDCNDDDATINPSAQEVCDGMDVDEDCDGVADDLDSSTDRATMSEWFVDEDGDGFGNPELITLACDEGEGRTTDDNDCDDKDPEKNPIDGCGVDWDGDWKLEGTVTVVILEKKLKDSCTFSLGVTIDSSSRETVRTVTRGVCYMPTLGAKAEAWVRGSFSDSDTIVGELYVDKDIIEFEASLTPRPDTWKASGTTTDVFMGYKAEITHELSGSR